MSDALAVCSLPGLQSMKAYLEAVPKQPRLCKMELGTI